MIDLLLNELMLYFKTKKEKREFVLKQKFSEASQLRDLELTIISRIKFHIGEGGNKTALNILLSTFLNEKYNLNLCENYTEKEILRELKILNLLKNV